MFAENNFTHHRLLKIGFNVFQEYRVRVPPRNFPVELAVDFVRLETQEIQRALVDKLYLAICVEQYQMGEGLVGSAPEPIFVFLKGELVSFPFSGVYQGKNEAMGILFCIDDRN